ncbi:MAG TPA: mechanosensitive ion channel [Thermoanaerobaculia bacterium]|nr:mechanosensitive ion channel [Thermoanaerobaculia bacterium]
MSLLAAAALPGRCVADPQVATAPGGSGTSEAASISAAPPPRSAGAPVVLDGKTLFLVTERLGPFGPQERATAAAERIQALARDRFAGDLELKLTDNETTTDVFAGERVVVTVSDSDAAAAGIGRHELAAGRAQAIERAVNAARREIGLKSLVVDGLWAFLATAVLVLLFYGLKKATPAALERLESWRGTRIPAIRIQRLEFVSAARVTDGMKLVVRALRFAVSLAAVLLYIPLVLSFFPWTRGLVGSLFGYVATPLRSIWSAFLAYLPDLFFLAVIVVLTRGGLKLVRLFFMGIEHGTIALKGFERDWARPTYDIVRFLIIAFAVVVAFPYIPGSQSAAFKGVSLFLGVLFSLSSSSAISNIVAGAILTYTKAFRIGDRVKIADTVGDVVEKSLLVTRVRTIKNVDITIPNGMVLGSHILNYSTSARDKGLILNTSVTIGYDAPWRDVHAALLAAARATDHVLETPPPFVLQTSLDDFYVSYEINVYTDEASRMAATYSDLHANIQDKFNEAGIEIMSPHYSSLRDGNEVTIPPASRPKTYETPPFRFLSLQRPVTPRQSPE